MVCTIESKKQTFLTAGNMYLVYKSQDDQKWPKSFTNF